MLNKVAEKLLGYSKRKVKNTWFDEQCKKALEYRKNTRLKTMEAGYAGDKKGVARQTAKQYEEGQNELI